MKITAFILIISLLGQAFSTKTEFLSLERSKLGRTLIDTIQIHLESEEPVETLVTMLNDMATTLEADQEEADTKHSEFQEKCQIDVSYYNTEIAESTNRINAANADIESLSPELTTIKQSLADTQANLDSLQEQLQSAQAQRDNEAEEYALKIEEHENALTIIHEAQSLFQDLVSETAASFLQKKTTVFAEVHNNIKSSIKRVRSGYQGIFKLLAQIVQKAPAQADQDIVNKILDLLKKIKENIEASADIEKVAEEQRISAFEDLSSALQQNINNAQSDIVVYTNKIDSLNTAISTDEDEVNQQTERLNQRQQQLGDRTSECNDESTSYETDREKRCDIQYSFIDFIYFFF